MNIVQYTTLTNAQTAARNKWLAEIWKQFGIWTFGVQLNFVVQISDDSQHQVQ